MVVAIAAYTVRNGLEVFTRANEIFFPLIMVFFILSMILTSKDIDLQRLLPVADAGVLSMAKGATVPLAWFGEIVTITTVIPYLNRPRDAHRVASTAILASGFILLVVVVDAIVTFGPDYLDGMVFPGIARYRTINIAGFLGRLEALGMANWVTGGFVKVSVFYWVTVLGIAQVLELKDYRPLVLPVGALLLDLSILNHPRAIDLNHFVVMGLPPFVATFAVVIPLLLLVTALARGKGGRSS
jgi:spore germination protein KB